MEVKFKFMLGEKVLLNSPCVAKSELGKELIVIGKSYNRYATKSTGKLYQVVFVEDIGVVEKVREYDECELLPLTKGK